MFRWRQDSTRSRAPVAMAPRIVRFDRSTNGKLPRSILILCWAMYRSPLRAASRTLPRTTGHPTDALDDADLKNECPRPGSLRTIPQRNWKSELLISTRDKLLISAGTMVVWDFDDERVTRAAHLVLCVQAVCRIGKPWRKSSKTSGPRRIAGNSAFRDCLPRPHRLC